MSDARTKHAKLIDLFKGHNRVKFFDGLSTNSSIRGPYVSTTASNERFSTNYAGSFAFLDKFLRDIKKSLENLPKKKEDILDKDIGYQFPTSDDVDKYIEGSAENDESRTALRNKVINIDKPSLTAFINSLIERIKSSKRVTYIAGKVGSGKTTFIDMIATVYEENFIKSKTIVVRLNHEDFAINNYIYCNNNIDSKRHIEKILYSKIIRSIVKCSDIRFVDLTKRHFKKEYNVNFDTIWEQSDDNLCKCAPSLLRYLSEEHTEHKILVIIDGFDILNPKETECYSDFVESFIAFMDGIFPINIHFLLTLRNCTLPAYRIGPRESFTIIPPNEKLIYRRAIKYFIKYGNDGNSKPFWRNIEGNIIRTFHIILTQISINLNGPKHNKTVIQLFDYDYRILLDYIHHILCYIISEKTKNTDRAEEDVEGFIRNRFYDLKDLNRFIKQKHYIVSDILLLKNNSTYDNLFTCDNLRLVSTEKRRYSEANKELSCLVNNVYNYCIYKTEDGTVFPLLIKIRILQRLRYNKKYTRKRNIIKFIETFGYDIGKIDLLLDDLLFSRFIKVHYNTQSVECEYNITNKGLYVIDDFCIQPTYTNHVISLSILPKAIIDKKLIDKYSPANQNAIKAIQIGMKNSFVFLNLVRDIETYEKSFLSKRDQDKYNHLFISTEMENHFITALTKIIPRWEIIDTNFTSNYESTIQFIKKNANNLMQ